MSRYFEPPDIGSQDRDPLVEPDRTSWFCLGRAVLVALFVALCFAIAMAVGFYYYLRGLPGHS
jgi:hypothetical protein